MPKTVPTTLNVDVGAVSAVGSYEKSEKKPKKSFYWRKHDSSRGQDGGSNAIVFHDFCGERW